MRKRLLAIIATAAMVVAMVPSMVFAANGLPDADGGVITLEDDAKLTGNVTLEDNTYITVKSGEEVTLNLNGYKLSGKSTTSTTSFMIKVPSNSKLTITNGSVSFYATTPDTEWGGEGQPPYPGYANNTIRNEGTLIVDGANIENLTAAGGASYVVDNYAGSNLVVESGKIDGHGKVAIRMFSGSATNPINVTVNGGTITGTRAIWVHLTGSDSSVACDANVTVTGGTLESTDDEYNQAIYVYSYGNSYNNVDVKISGGTLDDVAFTGGTSKGGNGSENVEITGGVINDTYGYGTDDNALGKYIKGGQFNEDVSAYVADDNAMVEVKDAAGNTTYYVGNAVADGVKNAPNGAEITVMKAAEGTELKEVPAGVKVVNDSDNTIKVNGTEVDAEGEITIKAPEKPEKPQDSPETGDNSMVPIAVAGLALAAMAAAFATKRRTN